MSSGNKVWGGVGPFALTAGGFFRHNLVMGKLKLPWLLPALFLAGLPRAAAASGRDYTYLLTGDPADAKASPQGGAMLEGGADDSEEAVRWLIRRAGGGDIVVLRTSEDEGTQEMFATLGKADSVETFSFASKAPAYDPFILGKIDQADGIFFAGGDQAEYVNFWKHTPVQEAVNRAIKRGVTVGGISAGLAILGQFQFEALNDTITSEEALKDPYAPEVTLGKDFLEVPRLKGIITDSHFTQRGRLGRLLVFMARLIQDGWTEEARGIGVDEETAVLVDDSGAAAVTGRNKAVFVRLSRKPLVCRPGAPLTAGTFEVVTAAPGQRFNVKTWEGEGRSELVDVKKGVLTAR